MKVHLAYGRKGMDIHIPDRNLQKVLTIGTTPPLGDPDAEISRALQHPLGSPSLRALADGKSNACILICDITRPVPNKMLLPHIVAEVEAAGVLRKDVTILIATGLHRPSTAEERELMLGTELCARHRVIDHHATVDDEQSFLGATKRGTPVYIDRRYVEADLKITVGFIEPHLMAGFSGGRKLIAPGCAGAETIKVLHSPAFLDSPLCREGSIDHNPLHAELLEIAGMAGHDFMLDVSLDATGGITGVFAGDPREAHAAGVRAVRGFVRATVPEPADIVITTSAGFPLDLTYYQAIKGMTAALPILKKGGMLILAAECAEGLGSEKFTSMATKFGSAEEFDTWIHQHSVEIDQWQLQECLKAVSHGDVVVVSEGIPPEQKQKLFVRASRTVEEAVAEGLRKMGPDATVAVIPKGPYTLVEVAPIL